MCGKRGGKKDRIGKVWRSYEEKQILKCMWKKRFIFMLNEVIRKFSGEAMLEPIHEGS